MPRTHLAKLTSKNQLTLPDWAVEQTDYPTHYEIYVREGVLMLFPGRIVSLETQAKAAGIEPEVLRMARKLMAERKKGAQETSS